MSLNNFNKSLTKILLKNDDFYGITFLDKIDSIEINGILSNIIYGVQDVKPCECPNCKEKNINFSIVKNGTKDVTVKHLKNFGYNCLIKIKKQRFKCKNCGKTFMIDIPFLVKRRDRISAGLKLKIAELLKETISLKFIAKECGVSISTVARIMDSHFSNFKPNFASLPEVLCFDEFKSTKDSDGAMSFNVCDGNSHKIVDIVEDRKLDSLIEYFGSYSSGARKKAKFVVIDMYSPYISLIKKCFPGSKIIIDRFHIVQLFNRALNKTRIRVMNNFNKKDHNKYNKLKRYWRLLLKDSYQLSEKVTYHPYCFKKFISERYIVEELISLDKELAGSYEVYQNILYAIRHKNKTVFENQLTQDKFKIVSNYMQTSIKSARKFKEYIKNALENPYSNGCMEGNNNKIKVIKRVSYGYKRFDNFKKRILICDGVLTLKIPSAS
ncbi:MAG: ISL3 family transposase [Enterococcus sp.]|nr:ISL3 family transposase [Enterococcus sp.]